MPGEPALEWLVDMLATFTRTPVSTDIRVEGRNDRIEPSLAASLA
jgi:hypothetical protein